MKLLGSVLRPVTAALCLLLALMPSVLTQVPWLSDIVSRGMVPLMSGINLMVFTVPGSVVRIALIALGVGWLIFPTFTKLPGFIFGLLWIFGGVLMGTVGQAPWPSALLMLLVGLLNVLTSRR